MGFLLQWLATTALELTIALVLALLGWKFVFGSLWARWLAPIFGEAASKSREQSKGWGLIRSLSIPGGMSSATELVPKGTSGSMFKGLAQVVRTQTVAEPCELSLKLLMQSSWSPEDLVQNKEALSMALKGFKEVATFKIPKNIGNDYEQKVLSIRNEMLSCGNEFGKVLAGSYILASQAVSYLETGIDLITAIKEYGAGCPVQEVQVELRTLRNIAEPQAVQSKKIVHSLGLVVTRMSGIKAETDNVLIKISREKEQAAEQKKRLVKFAKVCAGVGALAAATAATGGLIHLAAPGLFFGAASGAVTAGGVGLGSITTGVALSEAADNTKEAKVQNEQAMSAENALSGGELLSNNAMVVVKGITGLQVFWKGQVTALDDLLKRIDGEIGPDRQNGTVRMLQINLLL